MRHTCGPVHVMCPICRVIVNNKLKGMPLSTVNAAQTVLANPDWPLTGKSFV